MDKMNEFLKKNFNWFHIIGMVVGCGILMNLVPPKQINGTLIYSRVSYLAVFIFLALCALPVFFSSRRIVETMGQKTLQK